MPKYRITDPSGKTFEITAPEGATQDQVLAYAQSQFKSKPVQNEQAPDPTEGMSNYDKFAAGMGKAVYDVGRGAGQMLRGGIESFGSGDKVSNQSLSDLISGKAGKKKANFADFLGLPTQQDIDESRQHDSALMNTGMGTAGNITGNVAMALPTAFIPGVNTVTGGAAVGAGLSALQPTSGDESRLQNMAIGAAGGALLPAAAGAFKTAKAALYDPLAGQNKIIGGALARSAGDRGAEIARALRGQGAATPGVRLSAGQVSGSEGLSALEDAISTNLPGGELARSGASNRTALAGALRDIAQTPEALAAAKQARGAAAENLYGQARSQGVDIASLDPAAQANIAAFQQRIPEDILNRAKELAKISGVNMDNDSAIQGMHWVKKAIDSKIGQAVTSGDKEMARAYQGLQEDLINGMGQISPAYDAARQTFGQMSKPINQMEVGHALANKLVPSTAGDIPASLNYASLATAMRNPDRLAQQATGFSGAKMASVISPQQMGTVQGVTSDASKIAEALKRGMGTGSPTARRLAQGDMLAQHFAQEAPLTSKVLQLASNIPGVGLVGKGVSLAANVVGDKVQAQMLSKLDNMLANNPQQVAKLIEAELSRIAPTQRQQIIRALPSSVAAALPSALISSNASQ